MKKAPRTRAGLERGHVFRIGASWWYACTIWPGADTVLATPLSAPHWPARKALGPPRILQAPRVDEIVRQAETGMGTEGDPLKGSGR